MKLTDENGETWEVVGEGMTAGQRLDLLCKGTALIVDKVKEPANPMPELRPGMIARIYDRSLDRKDLIIIQDIARDGIFWGINIERGWKRIMFYDREIIEVCYPRTIDVIWSREGK